MDFSPINTSCEKYTVATCSHADTLHQLTNNADFVGMSKFADEITMTTEVSEVRKGIECREVGAL